MSAWTGEQIVTTFLTCKMPCEQFLNSSILKFYEGAGKLEKSRPVFKRKKVLIEVKSRLEFIWFPAYAKSSSIDNPVISLFIC